MEINWDELAFTVRLSMPHGQTAGSDAARRALEMILGEETLRSGVDYYIAKEPAYELVRSILWLLHPSGAIARCRELAMPPNELATRRSAVELLRVVADRRALPWVSGFLDDPDSQIQVWGIGVVDQLLFSNLIEPEEAEDVLEKAERHESAAVREQAESIRSYLRG
jgi:hypothetical protein